MKKPFIVFGTIVIAGASSWFWLSREGVDSSLVESASQLLQRDVNPLPDFQQYADVKAKKQAFFNYLQPIIEASNQRISQDRRRIEEVNGSITKTTLLDEMGASDRRFLLSMIQRYEVDSELTPAQQVAALLNRIDTVPVSLALTQAAMESAWGTSRFAREGNNLFGQWCYQRGCGIVPKRRSPDQIHEVARFANVDAAVSSYMRNINSHRAYEGLRSARATLRSTGQPVTGHQMAEHLLRYSQRGSAYVEELQSMIRVNKLAVLDQPT